MLIRRRDSEIGTWLDRREFKRSNIEMSAYGARGATLVGTNRHIIAGAEYTISSRVLCGIVPGINGDATGGNRMGFSRTTIVNKAAEIRRRGLSVELVAFRRVPG